MQVWFSSLGYNANSISLEVKTTLVLRVPCPKLTVPVALSTFQLEISQVNLEINTLLWQQSMIRTAVSLMIPTISSLAMGMECVISHISAFEGLLIATIYSLGKSL